jgi:hypothetical protein
VRTLQTHSRKGKGDSSGMNMARRSTRIWSYILIIFGTLGTVIRRFTHEAPTRIFTVQGRRFPRQFSRALHAKRRKKISDQSGTKEVFFYNNFLAKRQIYNFSPTSSGFWPSLPLYLSRLTTPQVVKGGKSNRLPVEVGECAWLVPSGQIAGS